MDCNLSQLLLTLGRADRGADDQAALDRHVAGCPACSALANRLTGFDSAVAAAMANVPVPTALHDNLLKAAYTRQGAIWRRTVYRYAALAAGIVLTVALISGGIWRYRPVLDAHELVIATEQDWDTRDMAVRAWLDKQGLPEAFPFEVDFDTRFYVFHGKGELAGRDVPVVVFQDGPSQLRLYVVREGQLNTKDLQSEEGSVWTTTFVRHPTAKGITYVVLHTHGVAPFLKRPRGPTA